jgi:hypothetical protein
MTIRETVGAALLFLSGCTNTTAHDDGTTGLTVSGSGKSLDAFLRSTNVAPHKWVVEKRWAKADGLQLVRLRWPHRPTPSEVGELVAVAQAARANGLSISDTEILETQP